VVETLKQKQCLGGDADSSHIELQLNHCSKINMKWTRPFEQFIKLSLVLWLFDLFVRPFFSAHKLHRKSVTR
jgi:hypothetical protein